MNLSKEQCFRIKGLAILLIMLHNYVDVLLDIDCNEMEFSLATVETFLNHVFRADSIWYILSFAGWVGVPSFFFLSGYGLTKKYGMQQRLAPGSYIKNHLIKLWMLIIPVYLVYFALYPTNLKSFVTQLTFTNTLLRYGKNGIDIYPGMYWFGAAILQFYLLFLVFRKLSNRWLWILCGAFVVFHYLIIYYANVDTMKWTRFNCLGWGETFILGIIAARNQYRCCTVSKRWNVVVCVVSLMALGVCMVTRWLAPLVEVSSIVFFISLSRIMNFKWVGFVGLISASIFVIHPLVRRVFYSVYLAPDQPLITTIIYAIITIISAWIHNRILKWFNSKYVSRITHP